ncbi:MAG: hypothetical protein AAF628_36935, partial [Planctomycetota bacterium]
RQKPPDPIASADRNPHDPRNPCHRRRLNAVVFVAAPYVRITMRVEGIPTGEERCQEFRLRDGDDRLITRGAAMARLRDDAGFAAHLEAAIARCPWEACFWETPPLHRGNQDQPFTMAVLRASVLAGIAADPQPFAAHLAAGFGTDAVSTFANLGGDSTLVAPCQNGPSEAYPHLAAFVRRARPEQRAALWRAVGHAVTERLGDTPLWLSTSGSGVSWLHVRLDPSPKYYTWPPYRAPDA